MAFEIPIQGLENIVFGTKQNKVGKAKEQKSKPLIVDEIAKKDKVHQDNGETSARN